MSLFVVRHQHSANRCPAADFEMGAGLLNHLSKTNARRHGVRIRGDAVLAAHTLLIIAEADSEDVLHEFLRPFEAAGTVSVESASTCAQVVAGGGCEGIAPALDPAVHCGVDRPQLPERCKVPSKSMQSGTQSTCNYSGRLNY